MRRIASAVLAVGLAPGAAAAATDWFASPSFTLTHTYDDNVFASAVEPEHDRVLQATPGLEVGGESPRLDLRASYSFDDEDYAEHSELDGDSVRERAGLRFRYDAAGRTLLTAEGTFVRTRRPGELDPEIGVDSASGRAEAVSLRPGVTYRLDRVTTASLEYTRAREVLADGAGADTHAAVLGWDRELSRRDTLHLAYSWRRFGFDGSDDTTARPVTDRSVTAHAVTAGVTRDFTRRTTASLRGGPRRSEGSVDLEAALSVRHRFEPGWVWLTYGRSLTTVVGQGGAVATDAIEVVALRPVGRAVELRGVAAWLVSERGSSRADVRRSSFEVSRRLSPYLSVTASWQSSEQRGSLDPVPAATIERNLFLVGVVLSGALRSRPEPEEPGAAPRWPRPVDDAAAEDDR